MAINDFAINSQAINEISGLNVVYSDLSSWVVEGASVNLKSLISHNIYGEISAIINESVPIYNDLLADVSESSIAYSDLLAVVNESDELVVYSDLIAIVGQFVIDDTVLVDVTDNTIM